MIYTRRRGGGEYELIGVSVGEGRTNMETRTVYRDLATGKIHHRLASDFALNMAPVGSFLPRKELLQEALRLRDGGKISWRAVAEQLGVKIGWLHHNLDVEGLVSRDNRRPVKATPELTLKAVKLREAGVCWKLIERQLGVNQHTLRRAVIEGRYRGNASC